MSNTAYLWLAMFGLFTVLSLIRPVYGVSLYLLTYFALPDFWWWGKAPLGGYRWTLIGGIILLCAAIAGRGKAANDALSPERRRITWLVILMGCNFTIVQFIIGIGTVTVNDYSLDMKFLLLFLCIISTVHTPQDLKILILSLVVGIGYLGYEVTINGRGKISHGRLEGVGIPGATAANDLGSLIVTFLPLAAALVICGKGWKLRLLAVAAGGLAFNVVLLVNSRGAFLSLIASGITLLLVATGKERKQALKAIGLCGLACLIFLGDPRILDRFMTTFASDEDRDHSAAGRIEFWKAGMLMIKDYPLGAGSKSFKKGPGTRYLRMAGAEEDRALHNGFINDAVEWGIQGAILRLWLIGTALMAMYRSRMTGYLDWCTNERFLAICVICGAVALMVTSIFGNFIDHEWCWLLMAVAVGICQVAANEKARMGQIAPQE